MKRFPFLFSLNHSLSNSGKDFEASSSSRDSGLSGASGFGGICNCFSVMCRYVDRFRQRMKLDIADRDIVILGEDWIYASIVTGDSMRISRHG